MEDTEIIPEHKKEGTGDFRYRQVYLFTGADDILKDDEPYKGKPSGEVLQIVAIMGALKGNYGVKPGLFQFRKEGTPGIPSPAVEEYGRNSGDGSSGASAAHGSIGG
jgi:hypothetical protein